MSEEVKPQTIEITHDQARAVNVLLAAVQVGQKAGAYSFQDSAHILEAVRCFEVAQPEEASEQQDEEVEAAS